MSKRKNSPAKAAAPKTAAPAETPVVEKAPAVEIAEVETVVVADATPVVGSDAVEPVEEAAASISRVEGTMKVVDNTATARVAPAVSGKAQKPVEAVSGIKQVNYL